MKLYPDGVKEWGDVISRFDSLDENGGCTTKTPGESAGNAEDHLAAWLEEMDLEEGGHESHANRCPSHPKIVADQVTLYRCSWCGNPSAALRKCSGCAKTRWAFLVIRGMV